MDVPARSLHAGYALSKHAQPQHTSLDPHHSSHSTIRGRALHPGHCKNLKGPWTEAAGKLKGQVKLGAVDCTAHQATCQQYGVQGYPTIKWFGANKQRPSDYQAGR